MKCGSVRFFKKLICFTVAGVILLQMTLCIFLCIQNHKYRLQLQTPGNEEPDSEARLPGLLAAYAGTEESPAQPDGVDTSDMAAPSYQMLYPDMYCERPKAFTVSEGAAYLTFDDGPSERTPEVLAILKEYGVKATFFVVGKSDERSQAWMRQIVEEGHTLAIHTYSHDYRSIYTSVESYLRDFNDIYELVHEATGTYPTIFRFPGGSLNAYNQGIYEEIIAEMLRRGFVYYDWDASTQDAASKTTVQSLVDGALGGASGKSRCILLAHDSADKGNTVAALPQIIEGLAQMGYSFDRLTPEVQPVTFGYK